MMRDNDKNDGGDGCYPAEETLGVNQGRRGIDNAVSVVKDQLEAVLVRLIQDAPLPFQEDYLSKLEDGLRHVLSELFPKNKLPDLLDRLKEMVAEGKITDGTLADWNIERIYPRAESGAASIRLACIYLILAEKALADGEREKAWSFIFAGSRFAGEAERCIPLNDPLSPMSRSEVAQKGGRSRAEKTRPTKSLAVKLLKEKRPRGGWLDAKQVAITIGENLKRFEMERPLEPGAKARLSPDNFINTLKRWLKDDELVSRAFNKYKRK